MSARLGYSSTPPAARILTVAVAALALALSTLGMVARGSKVRCTLRTRTVHPGEALSMPGVRLLEVRASRLVVVERDGERIVLKPPDRGREGLWPGIVSVEEGAGTVQGFAGFACHSWVIRSLLGLHRQEQGPRDSLEWPGPPEAGGTGR
jgi:hypothetical protein